MSEIKLAANHSFVRAVATIARTAKTSLPRAFSLIAAMSQRTLRIKPIAAPTDQAMLAASGELKFKTKPVTALARARSRNEYRVNKLAMVRLSHCIWHRLEP